MRIIVVDDDPTYRESLAESLRDDGHAVEAFESPEVMPSLEVLEEVAVLITDYQMNGMNGVQLADVFHARHPGIPILVVSAYESASLCGQVAARAWLELRPKSVGYDGLHALIHEMCASLARH